MTGMSYKEQAELIWGEKWNWHEIIKFEGAATAISPMIRDNVITDAIVLMNFIEYFQYKGDLPSLFNDYLCIYLGCDEEGHGHMDKTGKFYMDQHPHTPQEWVEMIFSRDYYQFYLEEMRWTDSLLAIPEAMVMENIESLKNEPNDEPSKWSDFKALVASAGSRYADKGVPRTSRFGQHLDVEFLS